MKTAIGLLVGLAILVAIMRPGLPPTMAFTSRPPDCAPGMTGPDCLPWRPTPPKEDKEPTPTPATSKQSAPSYQSVTPAWTIMCDKRPMVYFRDRVRYVREQRCWQE